MPLAVTLEKKCLGQITRTQIRPEITQGRGNCKECNHYPSRNVQCTAYDPIVFRTFSVAQNYDEENAELEKAARSYFKLLKRVLRYLYCN
jgi:hypothetical protein